MTCVAFSIKFAKTNQKIAEGICEIVHYYYLLFSFVSLATTPFLPARRATSTLLSAEVIVWISVFDLLGADVVPGASSFRVMRILRVVRLVPLRLSWI